MAAFTSFADLEAACLNLPALSRLASIAWMFWCSREITA